MKSIETKVAAAVAAGLMVVTVGGIAQTQSSGQPPNEYAPSINPGVNTHLGNRGYNNKPSVTQKEQRFVDEAAPSNGEKKSTNKAGKSSKHRQQRNQQH
jgi:hypothetical protein